MDILNLFDGLFSAFGVNRKMDSSEIELIKNNESAYRQEVYKRKQEIDDSRSKGDTDKKSNKGFSKDF